MREKAYLVAITGGSGSGKSRLAVELQKRMGRIAGRISLDDFYRDRSELTTAHRTSVNFDHPRAIDWRLFETVLRRCRSSLAVSLPSYDFASHSRNRRFREWPSKPIVIVDGLWLLRRPAIRSLFELRIYIDCPSTTRLARRLRRDVLERGRKSKGVREQFQKVVAPMHDRFVAPQIKWADIVLGERIGLRQIQSIVERIRVRRDAIRNSA